MKRRFFFTCALALPALFVGISQPGAAQTRTPTLQTTKPRNAQIDLLRATLRQKKNAPPNPDAQARIDALKSRLGVLENGRNDGVISPGLPQKKPGPGDRIPPSLPVFGLKRSRGQTYGTDRQGKPLVALTPRFVPLSGRK